MDSYNCGVLVLKAAETMIQDSSLLFSFGTRPDECNKYRVAFGNLLLAITDEDSLSEYCVVCNEIYPPGGSNEWLDERVTIEVETDSPHVESSERYAGLVEETLLNAIASCSLQNHRLFFMRSVFLKILSITCERKEEIIHGYTNLMQSTLSDVSSGSPSEILIKKVVKTVIPQLMEICCTVDTSNDTSIALQPTETDRQIIFYLSGAVLKWARKRSRTMDESEWCSAHITENSVLPPLFAARDRGGLISVSQPFYHFILQIEAEFRSRIRERNLQEELICSRTMQNISTFFFQNLPSARLAESIIKRYIRMRAHFHCKHLTAEADKKKKCRKNKNKGLRKSLQHR